MTVNDLIAELKKLDGGLKVFCELPEGDCREVFEVSGQIDFALSPDGEECLPTYKVIDSEQRNNLIEPSPTIKGVVL